MMAQARNLSEPVFEKIKLMTESRLFAYAELASSCGFEGSFGLPVSVPLQCFPRRLVC